ncbi:uncharacterized protein LOC106644006 [Copidosoma floridanum]|uniref:uncharacterized protein LOC106644006 n=1 Tax=Copidosoma floridanum TaxID=29053 RepID=UPI0006C96DBC|nr:uncharacterized protein LOC106644006 [Copidosoma floridanum]
MFAVLENDTKKYQTSKILLTPNEWNKILIACKNRSQMDLRPIHFATNILDPSYKGKNLTPDQLSKGRAMIFKLAKKFNLENDKLAVELIQYNSNKGIWAEQFIQSSINLVSPLDWWTGTCSGALLCRIAKALFELPCSSAATKRSFSTYG